MQHFSYKELKNHIHNELKITKDDIHLMIIEAVKNTVQDVMKGGYIDHTIERVVKEEISRTYGRGIGSSMKDNIRREIVKQVGASVNAKLKVDVGIRTQDNIEPEEINPYLYYVDRE